MSGSPAQPDDTRYASTQPTTDGGQTEESLAVPPVVDIAFPVAHVPQEASSLGTAPPGEPPVVEETGGSVETGLSVPPNVQLYERARVRVRHLRAKIE